MSQLNVNLTPDFEKALSTFMQIRGIRSKSQAVRVAVQESMERSLAAQKTCDFSSWLGLALGPDENPKPRFTDHAELW